MSDQEIQNSVLSREELSALLEELESGKQREELRRTLRPAGFEELTGARSAIGRAAQSFAEEQGRVLSTLHQTPIHLEFSHWEEISGRDFAASMLDTDLLARLDLGDGSTEALLLLNRSMVFGWMMLAFGAAASVQPEALPSRPYTRIEQRFLRRAADEVAWVLAKAMGMPRPEAACCRSLDPPASLQTPRPRPLWVASFGVEGLGELCALRVALSASHVEGAGTSSSASGSAGTATGLEEGVLEMPVRVHVEVGQKDVAMSAIAALRPGDELELERSSPSGSLVLVEGQPKFHAERGALGRQAAFRITETL